MAGTRIAGRPLMENLDLLVLRTLRDWRMAGRGALLATVVRTWGSAPRPVGAILALRDDGTAARVAQRLHLSEGTVRNHLSSAIGKTGARNAGEAVRIAAENGWLLG